MTRKMFDSTKAADIPAGSELVGGYVDGSDAWSPQDFSFFPGRTVVRICVFNDRMDADVIDIEPGNNNARGAVPWITAKWALGQTPTVYCFSDAGPVGYCISEVRSACDAAGVQRPLFLIAEWDNQPGTFDPTGDLSIIGKQYANSAMTGGHYDASIVVDHWPGIDKEVDMAFKDDPDAIAYRADVKTTLDDIKAQLAKDAHHTHIYMTKEQPPAPIGGRTSEPLEPPFPGAVYFSSDDSLSMIGWTDPATGKVRFFQNGVEVTPA